MILRSYQAFVPRSLPFSRSVDDTSKITTRKPRASEPQDDKGEMIFELSSLSSDKSKVTTEDLVPEKPDICVSGRMVRGHIVPENQTLPAACI